ncbi:MAG TPA: CHRD domain-containing protein [Vicinamibacterales bacterium]|nr:CHRD domain-containing protein [Vicinamibacterales bacterium]
MKRLAMLALVLAFGISCKDSPTTPSANPNVARFTAILLPSNEVPAITNADASASGTMQMTMTVTRDSANVITGATYDFTVHLTGFPANTTLTGAHIHNAPAGTNTGVVVGLPLVASDTSIATGQATITKTGLPSTSTTVPAATVAQGIFNNPAGNYFNVHTSLNTGGAIRGQLVRLD